MPFNGFGAFLIAFIVFPVTAHVPTYSGACDDNCCHLPHAHTTSQVVYLKDSGGLELDISDLDTTGDGEIIDFNIVFKEEYDINLFDIYVGCGGCASGSNPDPLLVPPLAKPASYRPGKLEPFTQTGLFPLLPSGAAREFNTTLLATCASDHWSIRLVTNENATETIVFGIVVGCEGFKCEKFTLVELLSFPIYVIRNHGPVWNDLAWTLPVIAAFVLLTMPFSLYFWVKDVVGVFYITKAVDFKTQQQIQKLSWRAILYFIAIWALFTDLFETFVHFLVAAVKVGASDSQGYNLFFGLVLIFGKVVPIVLVCLIWHWLNTIVETAWRSQSICGGLLCKWPSYTNCHVYFGSGFYAPIWAHGAWSLIELVGIGLAGFIWLGAGFFVFPTVMTLAAIVRIYIWLSGAQRRREYYLRVEVEDPPQAAVQAADGELPNLATCKR